MQASGIFVKRLVCHRRLFDLEEECLKRQTDVFFFNHKVAKCLKKSNTCTFVLYRLN